MSAMFFATFEFDAGPPAERYRARETITVYSADARSTARKDVRASYTKAKAKARAQARTKLKSWDDMRGRGLRLVSIECVG